MYASTIDMKITDHTFEALTDVLAGSSWTKLIYVTEFLLTHIILLGLIMLVYSLGYLLFALDELVSHGFCS
jgi:hypothetical protein